MRRYIALRRLQLQPEPTRAVRDAVKNLYRRVLGRQASATLEFVCDGQTRLPAVQRRRAPTALHASAASLAAGQRRFGPWSRFSHAVVPELCVPAARDLALGERPFYALPFSDDSFDAVVTHACMAYATAPLPLFADLYRVLKPTGTLVLTFQPLPACASAAEPTAEAYDGRALTQALTRGRALAGGACF